MKKIMMTLAVAFFAVGSYATELTYEEFVEACKNPDAFGQQIPPEQIKVLCIDEKLRWQPIESGVVTLDQSRLLSAELFSDKFHVDAQEYVLELPEAVTSCPRHREVLETAAVELPLTCAQVLNDKRTLRDICEEAIDEAIAANPDIVETVPTGRTHNACEESKVPEQEQQEDGQEDQQDGQTRL